MTTPNIFPYREEAVVKADINLPEQQPQFVCLIICRYDFPEYFINYIKAVPGWYEAEKFESKLSYIDWYVS